MRKNILTVFILFTAIALSQAQGAYLEYKITSTQAGVTGSTKLYSRDGSVRSEMTMAGPQVPGGLTRVALILRDSVHKSFLLDVANKTYIVADMKSAQDKEDDPAQYTITVVGKEKINGYNATHLKVRRAGATKDEDVWISTDVANYKKYMSMNSQYAKDGFFKAIAAKGLAGFPVRTELTERGMLLQVDLVKSEIRTNDAALFSLAGYTRVEGSAQSPSGPTADLIKKLQNMTPDQRKQYLEQMKQQQQSAQPH